MSHFKIQNEIISDLNHDNFRYYVYEKWVKYSLLYSL